MSDEYVSPRVKQIALYNEGIASTMDEAADMLLDMGEIDEDVHADLLSDEEADSRYG